MSRYECWELLVGHEIYVFASHDAAMDAAKALSRGASIYRPASPSNPSMRIGISALQVSIQRREMDIPAVRAMAALGSGVRQITDRSVPALPMPATPAPAGMAPAPADQ